MLKLILTVGVDVCVCWRDSPSICIPLWVQNYYY